MRAKQPFEAVVERHGPAVLRVCRAVLGGPGASDVDDAWSQTFLSALRAWPDLPADANVEAWLVTIAHRTCLDAHRRRARHAVPVADVPDAPSAPGVDVDTRLDVWALLSALPERQRLALAYHHLAGLPYRDVAAVLGGTPEAARRAAADGLATVRRRLRLTTPNPPGQRRRGSADAAADKETR